MLKKQALFIDVTFVNLQHDTCHISIAPVGEHFSRTLFMLQQNDEIRMLTRLKRLLSVDHTSEWIREQKHLEDKYTFAIIHCEYGMIGIVAFEQYGTGALFYYWIGEEYQNSGFGTSALRLLMNVAQLKGVELIYSSVFEGNNRSKHVLLKNGFTQLPDVYKIGTELLPVFCNRLTGNGCNDHQNVFSVYDDIARKSGFSIKKPKEVTTV